MRFFASWSAVLTTRPLAILISCLAVFGVFVGFGGQAFADLIPGGFDDPGSEASTAATVRDDIFGSEANLVLAVGPPAGASLQDEAVIEAGTELTRSVADLDHVSRVSSGFLPGGEALLGESGSTALVVGTIDGGTDVQDAALAEVRTLAEATTGLEVHVGGALAIADDITAQVATDLGVAELIAVPITLVLLLFVFGSVTASLLPLLVGGFSVFGAFFTIFAITRVTEVSVFSINLVTGLGLGLAIDYSLLIVSRFREELARLPPRADDRAQVRKALTATMTTAGRTVLFTGVAVTCALAALLVFPVVFLRSFGFAGIAVVIVSLIGGLALLPAVLMLLGRRVDAGRLRHDRPVRSASMLSPRWRTFIQAVFDHPVIFAVPVIAVLALMTTPVAGVTFGSPDDRVLNEKTGSRMVGDAMREDFPALAQTSPYVLLDGADEDGLTEFVTTASALPGVSSARAATGMYVDGHGVAPADPTSGLLRSGRYDLVQLVGPSDAASDEAKDLVAGLRALPVPEGSTVRVGGYSATLVDNADAIVSRLPVAGSLICLTTFILLYLFTGSVLLPIKAIVLNGVALAAVLGVMTWIFHDGHLSDLLGFTPGPMDMSMPILLFCIAFGLSTDYEIFLLSRVREWHLAGARLRRSVSSGIASSARITTVAALVLAVTFIAFGTSKVSFVQLFGLGTALAILLDATLIRCVLVPALMRIAGAANWWAPKPLRTFHERFGIAE